MKDSPNALVKKPCMTAAIDALKVDIFSTLESPKFDELSAKEELYALYGVLTEAWWEDFTDSHPQNLGLKPEKLRAARFFLKTPFAQAHKKIGHHIQQWAEQNQSPLIVDCIQAGEERANLIQTAGEIGTAKEVFLRRFKQGLHTAIDNSFKLPLLVWQLCDGENLSEAEFQAIIKNSQNVLNFLATTHLTISMLLDERLELGNNQSLEELEGFDSEFFEVVTKNGTPCIKPKSAKRGQEHRSPIAFKQMMQNKKPALKQNTVGCPAFHSKIVEPMSLMTAQYFWNCQHVK